MIFFFAHLCKEKSVFNTAAALEDIRIFAALIAFASYLRGTQLELGWQTGFAAPLYILGIIVTAFVCAAHHIDAVQFANVSWAGACELGHRRRSTSRCLLAGAKC